MPSFCSPAGSTLPPPRASNNVSTPNKRDFGVSIRSRQQQHCMQLPALTGDMARSENHLEELDVGDSHVTKNFHHPYTPYAIQETFMGTVYDVLEAGKVGILESPSKFLSGHAHYILLTSSQLARYVVT